MVMARLGEQGKVLLGASAGLLVGFLTARAVSRLASSQARCPAPNKASSSSTRVNDASSPADVPDLTVDGHRLQPYEQEVRVTTSRGCHAGRSGRGGRGGRQCCICLRCVRHAVPKSCDGMATGVMLPYALALGPPGAG